MNWQHCVVKTLSVAVSIAMKFDCIDCSVAQLYTDLNKKELT